jgi:hypothetical protein
MGPFHRQPRRALGGFRCQKIKQTGSKLDPAVPDGEDLEADVVDRLVPVEAFDADQRRARFVLIKI